MAARMVLTGVKSRPRRAGRAFSFYPLAQCTYGSVTQLHGQGPRAEVAAACRLVRQESFEEGKTM